MTPASTRRSRGASRISLGVVDQILSSGTNFALIFMLARSGSAGQFGALAIAFGIQLAAIGVSRGTAGTLLALDLPSGEREDEKALTQGTFTLFVFSSFPVMICLGVWAFATDGPIGSAIALFAASTVLLSIQDYGRVVTIAIGRPGRATLSDSLWFAASASGLAASYFIEIGFTVSVLVWVGGLFLATLVVLPEIPLLNVSAMRKCVLADRRMLPLFGDAMTTAVFPVFLLVLIGLCAGPEIAGFLRGASTLFGPIGVVIATVPLVVLPEAVRRSDGVILFAKTGVVLGVLTMGWAIVLLMIPDSFGQALMGATWQGARSVIAVLGVETTALAIWICLSCHLKLRDQAREVFLCRLLYVTASVSLVVPVAAVATGAIPIALARLVCSIGLVLAAGTYSLLPPSSGKNAIREKNGFDHE